MSLKEENLIAYNGTLKKGQRLVKVGNTFMPVGGAFEPGSGGGGSNNMKFYKCASVDTANNTWSGYELILQDGVYTVSETMTEGLTYVGFMPFADRIYSADGMLEVSRFYERVLLVSPTGMTSNENDEWVITCSSRKYEPYNAFTGNTVNPVPGWQTADYSSTPQWIQWQNKSMKVKITSYSLQATDNVPEKTTPKNWILYGSDDGVSWAIVDERTDGITSCTQYDTFTFECQNPGSYYYYRLHVEEQIVKSIGYVFLGQIRAYGQFE